LQARFLVGESRRTKVKRKLIFPLFIFTVFLVSYSLGQEAIKPEGLKISSPIVEDGGQIPRKYTCDGVNVNPTLKIENIPIKTNSLALVFDDVDGPRGSYVHWILWNIDPGTKEIKENSIPKGAVQGRNDFKKNNYGGPCPPSRAHRYLFKIYALDVRLNLNPNSTKTDLEKAMKGHVIAQAQLVGVYKRK